MSDPTRLSGIQPKSPFEDLADKIREQARRITNLETASTGNAMVVDGGPGITAQGGGGITIADGGALQMKTVDSTLVLYAGTTPIPDGSGRTQQVFEVGRDDGTLAFALADLGIVPGHPHQQALVWLDRSSTTVFADDTVSGLGIARPHLSPMVPVNTNIATWPSTSATTWTDIAFGYVDRQNPQLTWTIACVAGSGITGQFRLMVAGQQIGTTQTVTNSTFYWSDTQPLPASVPMFQDAFVELQAQVTAGSSTVSAQFVRWRGDQS